MLAKPSWQILYVATGNTGKFAEFRELINTERWVLQAMTNLSSVPVHEETGKTFLENARIKAHAVRSVSREAVLADDSGLVVPALKGAPGVKSRRYAGPEGDDAANNAKLIREISAVPSENRQAEFVCCLVFIDAHGQEYRFMGSVKGTILTTPRGEDGFGYDPLFLVDGGAKTMAELSLAEKNQLSHRALAAKAFLKAFG